MGEGLSRFGHIKYVCLFSHVNLACTVLFVLFCWFLKSLSDILLYSWVVPMGSLSWEIVSYYKLFISGYERIFSGGYFLSYRGLWFLECGSIPTEWILFVSTRCPMDFTCLGPFMCSWHHGTMKVPIQERVYTWDP